MTSELKLDTKIIDSFVKMDYNDYKHFCRLCMYKKTRMRSIFSIEGTVEELHFCTGILVSKEDGLPTMLCYMCISKLSVAYKFKTACLRSNDLFRTIFEQKANMSSVKNEPDNNDYEYMVTKTEVEDDDDYAGGNQYGDDNQDGDDNHDGDNTQDINDNRNGDEIFANNDEDSQTKPHPTQAEQDTTTSSIEHMDENETQLDKKVRRLVCRACSLEFSSKQALRAHTHDNHGGEWICEICGKQFVHRASHYGHMKSHFPPQYKCSDCDYKTSHKSDMTKHIRIHTGNKLYVCEYCTYSFYNSSNLWGHIRRKHSGAHLKKYPCPRCDLTFYSTDKLRRHVDSHDNIKRFECDVCHTAFTRRCYWKKHLLKQHSVVVPQIRPGRRKVNVVREEKNTPLLVVDASVK